MPNEHRADPTPPPHHGQGRGGSKKESSSLRVSPALHPPERPSPRHADIADHGLGRETRERYTNLLRPGVEEAFLIYYLQTPLCEIIRKNPIYVFCLYDPTTTTVTRNS